MLRDHLQLSFLPHIIYLQAKQDVSAEHQNRSVLGPLQQISTDPSSFFTDACSGVYLEYIRKRQPKKEQGWAGEDVGASSAERDITPRACWRDQVTWRPMETEAAA